MTNTWARAEVILDANGDLLPAQVRREATRAGNIGGDSASRSFADTFRQTIGPRLRGVFSGIGNSLRSLGRDADDTSGRMNNLGRSIRRTAFQFGNTVPMLRFRYLMMDIGKVGGSALRSLGSELGELSQSFDNATQRGEFHRSMWRRLSANTRQWTLIVTAVIASMSELAVLSSAAGSGLFVLAGGLAAVIAGLGVTIAAWAVFSKDIEDLPAQIRPARAAMSRLGDAFKELGDEIAIAAFEGTEDSFDSLGKTVKALTPAFRSVGRVINRLFRDFAKTVKPGTEIFEDLLGFIDKSGGIFDRVVRIVGRLGAALLNAFNNPAFQRSLGETIGYIDILFTRFANFLAGPGFEEWLANGRAVFGAFGDLLDTTGRLLNNLVTEESVQQLVDFFGYIEGFLQTGGAGILEFAQELDIFGILAQTLETFGRALEPLRGPMADLAGAIRDIFDAGLQSLGPVIEDVANALAPFVQALADFMKENPQAIADGLLVIAGAFVVLKGAKGILGLGALVGSFIGRMDKIVAKKGVWLAAITGLTAGILTALPGADDGNISGQDVITGFVDAMILGFLVGGPVGAAIGFVASLFTTMIQDMFFDETVGAWELGWQQIMDFNASEIGLIFVGIQEGFTAGMVGALAALVVGFQDWLTAASAGWNNIRNFFTVSVPQFFADWRAGINAGFLQIAAAVTIAWETVRNRFALGWQQIVTFFTVSLPGFFNQFAADIRTGVGSFATAFASGFSAAYNTVVSWTQRILATIRNFIANIPVIGNIIGPGSRSRGGGTPGFANGGVLYGPRHILAGEAGAEAIVPLNRALSQVDPSVRWLSAIAQGKMPAMAGGGIVGAGKQVNVSEGAIVITEAGDPRRTANDVINRLAEYVNG